MCLNIGLLIVAKCCLAFLSDLVERWTCEMGPPESVVAARPAIGWQG